MKKLIAGADLSLTGTGIVILENEEIIFQSLIKSKPTTSPLDEVVRLRGIINQIPLAQKGRLLDLVVIEGLAFMARNTTALVQLAGLNYLLRDTLVDLKIPFVIVAPTTLKKFVVGKGNAGKDEIMLHVYKKWGVELNNDNLADAYALAQIGLSLIGQNQTLNKPQTQVLQLMAEQKTTY